MKLYSKLIGLAVVAGLVFSPTFAIGKGGSSGGFGGGFSRGASSSSFSSSFSKPAASAPSTPSFSKPSVATPSTTTAGPTSNGFSKPAASAPSTTTAGPTSNGFSKPGSNATSNGTIAPATGSLGNASVKANSAASLSAYQSNRNSATSPPPPAIAKTDPVYRNASSAWGGDPARYQSQRVTVINNYRSNNPGVYVITSHMSPSYGMYDSGFLTGMVLGAVGNSISNAIWMNAQVNQPWYPSYRAELEAQAADNADLREHLSALDAEMAAQRANGAPTTVTTLPPGVDPALAFTPESVVPEQTQSNSHILLWILLVAAVSGGIAVVARR